MFVAHILAEYWLVVPSLHPAGLQLSWLDFAAFFGVGGIWLAMFIAILQRGELLPRNDPRIEHLVVP